MSHTPTALALIVLLLLAGCSADPSGGADGGATVTANDNAFAPAAVDVPPGATVTFVNDDDVAHTVAFDDDRLGASDLLESGDEHTVTFDEAGTFAYVCTVHPEMTGAVTVAAAQ